MSTPKSVSQARVWWYLVGTFCFWLMSPVSAWAAEDAQAEARARIAKLETRVHQLARGVEQNIVPAAWHQEAKWELERARLEQALAAIEPKLEAQPELHKQKITLEVQLARLDVARAAHSLEMARKLFKKGALPQMDVQQEEISCERAKIALALLEVDEQFSRDAITAAEHARRSAELQAQQAGLAAEESRINAARVEAELEAGRARPLALMHAQSELAEALANHEAAQLEAEIAAGKVPQAEADAARLRLRLKHAGEAAARAEAILAHVQKAYALGLDTREEMEDARRRRDNARRNLEVLKQQGELKTEAPK